MIRQYELVETVRAYDPGADEDALNRAYVFAMKAHGSQMRASGDPYFSHPLEVAGILTQLKLDDASIITALLHDVVEDTDHSVKDIEALFGAHIARLVDGVTKLTRIELQSDQTQQAENFRKLVLAMSEDIRVLLVKLADRLHNMRTLRFIESEDKRRRIARETMDIYVPLAERIGLRQFKDELEDLSFRPLNPDARESIVARLEFLHRRGGGLVDRVIEDMRLALKAGGVEAQVSGREKTPYSIWRKMKRKNVAFEQLSDIMAFRVAVDDVAACYHALGLLHSHYRVVPGRFKDYISTPKPNGYRSIHTGLIGPEQQRIEVQIRTQEMHEVADRGLAAHWEYKAGGPAREGPRYRWLRDFLDILEHAANPQDFLEHTKMEMFSDQVFCFTPKGDLIDLPGGATVVDFAYKVHSEIGDRCERARINGRQAPLRTVLHNGDQVEVFTNPKRKPSPAWERFVVTGKAKAHIRRFIRLQRRKEHVTLGREILQKAFRQEGHALSEKILAQALKKFGMDGGEDLYAAVGEGLRSAAEVVRVVFPDARPQHRKAAAAEDGKPMLDDRRSRQVGDAIPIHGLIPGMAVHFARCCHPIPGDRIVGIVTTGKGVTVHTRDCVTLDSFADMPERWLDVAWADADSYAEPFVGRLKVTLENQSGTLNQVTSIIAKGGGNISNFRIINRTSDYFDMLLDIEVRDVEHLSSLVAGLRANPAIASVDRSLN